MHNIPQLVNEFPFVPQKRNSPIIPTVSTNAPPVRSFQYSILSWNKKSFLLIFTDRMQKYWKSFWSAFTLLGGCNKQFGDTAANRLLRCIYVGISSKICLVWGQWRCLWFTVTLRWIASYYCQQRDIGIGMPESRLLFVCQFANKRMTRKMIGSR